MLSIFTFIVPHTERKTWMQILVRKILITAFRQDTLVIQSMKRSIKMSSEMLVSLSTALYSAYTAYTAYIVYTFYTVNTVSTFYTIQTAFTVACMPVHANCKMLDWVTDW